MADVAPAQLVDVDPGARIDRYEVVERLACGRSSAVYRALDTEEDRQVALKLVAAPAGDEAALLAELKAVEQLEHERLATIYRCGSAGDGRVFIAMELVDGVPLAGKLQNDGPLAENATIALAEQLLDAIECAHRGGVVHGELTPKHILVVRESPLTIKVVGFDTTCRARLCARDERPARAEVANLYLAPERMEGGDAELDRRTDVFTVGAILYRALTGQFPFQGIAGGDSARLLAELAPTVSLMAPGVGVTVGEAIDRAIHPIRDERHATAAEFASALREARAESDSYSGVEFTSGSPFWFGVPMAFLGGVAATAIAMTFLVVVASDSGPSEVDVAATTPPRETVAIRTMARVSRDLTAVSMRADLSPDCALWDQAAPTPLYEDERHKRADRRTAPRFERPPGDTGGPSETPVRFYETSDAEARRLVLEELSEDRRVLSLGESNAPLELRLETAAEERYWVEESGRRWLLERGGELYLVFPGEEGASPRLLRRRPATIDRPPLTVPR